MAVFTYKRFKVSKNYFILHKISSSKKEYFVWRIKGVMFAYWNFYSRNSH